MLSAVAPHLTPEQTHRSMRIRARSLHSPDALKGLASLVWVKQSHQPLQHRLSSARHRRGEPLAAIRHKALGQRLQGWEAGGGGGCYCSAPDLPSLQAA